MATLKQIHQKALELNKKDFDELDLLEHFQVLNEDLALLDDERVHYVDDNPEYCVIWRFENFGTLVADCYSDKEIDQVSDKREAIFKERIKNRKDYENYDDILIEVVNENPFPDKKFTVDVLDTRGFSDSSNRTDTRLSWLDVGIATDEAISKHLGKHKMQPWELRSAMFSSGMVEDFNMSEDEIEDVISMAI